MTRQKNPKLSVDELRTMLHGYFKLYRRRQAHMQRYLEEAFREQPQEDESEPMEIGEDDKPEDKESLLPVVQIKLEEMLIDVIAHRLKRNRRSVPLLTPRIIGRCIGTLINELDEGMSKTERGIARVFFADMLVEQCRVLAGMVSLGDEDAYEHHWKWIRIVLDLAQERRMTPGLLLLNRAGLVREMNRMIGADMADITLKAAVLLQNATLTASASRVVLLRGSYGEDSRQLAAKHNRDPDLAAIRATILKNAGRR